MDFITGETLLIDKPKGWTSFDAVKRLRSVVQRRTGVRKLKVGHAGTLDPLATGVMIIVTGRRTKLIEQLQSGVKEYVADLVVGASTASHDLEKPIDSWHPTDHITDTLIEQVIERFHGVIEQIPPAFSACKVDGRRAYKIARTGGDPGLKPKTLVIDEIEILSVDREPRPAQAPAEATGPQIRIRLRIVCSKGTYIRALARDIGLALDSAAYLAELRRTRVGDVTVGECLTIDQATEMLAECSIEYPEGYQAPQNQ